MEKIGATIQDALRETFDKEELVVLLFKDDIHFMSQEDITDLIDTFQNLLETK